MIKIPDMEKIRKIYHAGPNAVIGHIISLYEKIRKQAERIRKLTKRNRKLTEHIKTLESQLAKNSTNSGKPPSSDGLNKPRPKSLKELNKGQRKPNGGQPGHEGRNLKMSDKPDVIKILENITCKECAASLAGKDAVGYEKRHVYELVIKILVVEHRAEIKQCDCGTTTVSDFPKHVSKSAQYGAKMLAFLVYLNQYQLVPYKRTVELIRDMTGHTMSEGTLNNAVKNCHNALESFENRAKELLISAPVEHFDETGMRYDKKLIWVHTACTSNITLLFAHRGRGQDAMNAFGILPNFQGVAVHDCMKSYYGYACLHALLVLISCENWCSSTRWKSENGHKSSLIF